MGFLTTPKWAPNFNYPSYVGWKLEEIVKKLDFSLWNDKTQLLSLPRQQLLMEKLFVHMFRRQMWTCFRNQCIFAHFTMISVHLLNRRNICISETAASICMSAIPLERVLHLFFLCKRAISPHQVRPTAIAVSLFQVLGSHWLLNKVVNLV